MTVPPTTDELTASGLRLDLQDRVATLTLHRPERKNCQGPAMWQAMAAVGAGLPEDISVVVVRGAGDTFSAGLDLRLLSGETTPGEVSIPDLMSEPDERVAEVIGQWQEGFTWLRDPRFVSIAAVQGHAVGAGFQLALSCDLRVLADDATLCMKEPALGLVPDLTGTQPLVEAVGFQRALEICATARRVGAAEAAAIGLALTVVPAPDLDAAVSELAGAIAGNPAAAVRGTHELLAAAGRRTFDEQRRAERERQVGLLRALLGGA